MYEPDSSHVGKSSHRRRLPPIQAIGKMQSVDMEEPPDIPMEIFGYEADGDLSYSSALETFFDANDAEESVKQLRKVFHVVNPGRYALKKSPEAGGGHFIHCPRSPALACHYGELRKLMENRARIEFVRDCMSKIRAAAAYVEELEGLVHCEYRTAYAIRHGCASEAPVSKLYCLNALCEDLRIHVNHWNSIKQKLNSNKWLQSNLGFLSMEVDYVKRMLTTLCDKAIWWLDKLIITGFEVFAHCDMDKLTPEVLWNVTRGLEEFNTIALSLRSVSVSECSTILQALLPSKNLFSTSCLHLDPSFSNFPCNLSHSVKGIPFSKVLTLLAKERSRYAASLTHRFFTVNEEFVKILKSGHLPVYLWNTDQENQNQKSSQMSKNHMIPQDTSDYHTETGSNTSLSATLLSIGSIHAPDLSIYMSPLVDFSRREQEFTENFLLVVCNSTNLLRKNESTKKVRQKDGKATFSPVVGRPPRVQSDMPVVLSRSDSRRKTVSWGDNADSSVRNQIVSKYMDIMWACFGQNLDLCLDEPSWEIHKNVLKSEFGSVLLSNDTLIAVLRHMMEHVCIKDIFPQGSVQPLLKVAHRLTNLSAYSAWDTALCNAVSSQAIDKCYPCLLSDGEYSTKTDNNNLLPRLELDNGLQLAAGIACRLLTTCQSSHIWCTSKVEQFLASWAVNPFLLVIHADLRILVDETKQAAFYLQTLNSQLGAQHVLSNHISAEQINFFYKSINKLNSQLQSLSGSSMKTFSKRLKAKAYSLFEETMPPAKSWKRKTASDFPVEANPYVEQVLECILEPVIEGVNKLKLPSQISVISLATKAICEAWTTHILKEKIKFSVTGAQQLGADFTFLKTWLSQCIINIEVKQSILELTVFKYLNGVVLILKKQPRKRGVSRFRDPCSVDDLRCDTGNSVPDVNSSQLAVGGLDMDNTHDESDIYTVPNMEEWMALRVHDGLKKNGFATKIADQREKYCACDS
ncbi:hypothetical protein LOTGIDRAFT_239156 [Lottia gigantea]|uniref:Coiled-coil protein 142 C-terminal domain-containing protein n=1 Tax=Lottia gigantea TaxID=225164 RepID=V4A082_LOTGI|nr:hypothetical protein LOTGIDRAFT_239156 [Lottia gigantea]ESO97213.1 hypothetical protein LOTGIDRAFT_239156 [Lottia gigantea]